MHRASRRARAHTSVSDIARCARAAPASQRGAARAQGLDAYLEEIMETGVDEMSWDDLGKNDMEWPDVARVTEYRRQVTRWIRTDGWDG